MPNTDITPVELLTSERPPLSNKGDREREKRITQPVELPAEFLAELEAQRKRQTELGAGEKFQRAWSLTTKIIPLLFKIIVSFYMKDWKTTVTAIVTAVAAITAQFGFDLGAEVQTIIISVGMCLVGYFAKDAKKPEEAKP
jgi:hypothetical protein